MWEKFHNWNVANQDAITWFLIGLLFGQGFYEVGHGNYIWGLTLWAFALLNYVTRKVRLS